MYNKSTSAENADILPLGRRDGEKTWNGDEDMEKPMIRVEDVTKTYRNGDVKNRVLNHVSFTIAEGELAAVVGDSGSGKTTLMNLLGALDRPDSGRIVINQKDISLYSQEKRTLYRRNNIGFIFQDFNLIQVLNVYENILLPLQLGSKKVDEKKIDFLLEKLRLLDKKYALPTQLSGGEQQRVAVIRALIHNPDLILADEPTGNLDSKNTAMVIKLMQILCRKMNRTTVLVTHNMQIAKLCDRIIWIKDGTAVPLKA